MKDAEDADVIPATSTSQAQMRVACREQVTQTFVICLACRCTLQGILHVVRLETSRSWRIWQWRMGCSSAQTFATPGAAAVVACCKAAEKIESELDADFKNVQQDSQAVMLSAETSLLESCSARHTRGTRLPKPRSRRLAGAAMFTARERTRLNSSSALE